MADLQGYNGGNLTIITNNFSNSENLIFVSSGGNGGPGQDGMLIFI